MNIKEKSYTYTTPRKNYKGLWETTVKDERGFTVAYYQRTTKKRMTQFIKEELKGAVEVGTNE